MHAVAAQRVVTRGPDNWDLHVPKDSDGDWGTSAAENGGVDEEAAADFLQAADAGDISVLQQMADRTDLLEAQDEMGNTALHLAALNAHVRLLIPTDLDIFSRNEV